MITLKTLPTATAQEVYDQVKTHLLAQNKRSLSSPNVCVYRSGNLKCAAGILIGDDEYKPEMDRYDGNLSSRWTDLWRRGLVPYNHKELIYSLQKVHDLTSPSQWKEKLIEVATTYNLVP